MVTTFCLKVEINGETPFTSISGFTLVQRYGGHHSFELRVPLQDVESRGTDNLEKSKNYLGQSIKFEISETNADGGAGAKQGEFNGVITAISLARYNGVASDLIIKGSDPVIILDHGLNTKVFAQMSLSALVSSVTSKYPFNGVQFKVNPNPDPQLAFIHQHKQSSFDFLCRLANRYGQWFLYDGANCIFGKLSAGTAVALKFGSDLTDFKLNISLAPTKFTTIGIDPNGKAQQAPAAPVAHLDQLGSFAFDQSNKYFFEEQTFNTEQSIKTASDVQDIALIRRAGIAAGLVKLTGSSVNAKLKIGGNISVSAENISNNSNTDYGTFTVIALKHILDGRGNYRNNFEALPSAIDVPPPIGSFISEDFDSSGTD